MFLTTAGFLPPALRPTADGTRLHSASSRGPCRICLRDSRSGSVLAVVGWSGSALGNSSHLGRCAGNRQTAESMPCRLYPAIVGGEFAGICAQQVVHIVPTRSGWPDKVRAG
jgi:hypothetical protein